jgi:two-component system sensor histidine kinase UhpB
VATLTLNPASEQQEALDNLVGMLGVLAGYGVVMLLAVYWTLRKALTPLKPILGAIDRYERNDFTGRLPGLPFKEMDTIARALNHLAASLERTQQARRTLSLKLVSSQEDERMRIARELHDEFGQALTALRADAAWLGRKVTADPETGAVVAGIAAHCERMHLDIRSLLGRLRPYDRGEGGDVSLGRLLEDLVRSWNDRPGQATRFRLDYEPRDMRLPNELALGIYRLTQEALTNSVRHAQATQTSVTLRAHPDGSVDWSVQDDGVGIEEVDAGMQRGNGLAGMRERAWALGGEIELTRAREHPSRPGLRLSARFARPAGG